MHFLCEQEYKELLQRVFLAEINLCFLEFYSIYSERIVVVSICVHKYSRTV